MKSRRRPARDPRDEEVVSRVDFSIADIRAGLAPKLAALLGMTITAPAPGPLSPAPELAARRAPAGSRRMSGLERVEEGRWKCTLGGVPWILRSSGGRWVAEGGGETREAGSFKEIVSILRKGL